MPLDPTSALDAPARPTSLTQYASYLATQVAKAAGRLLNEGFAGTELRPPHFAVLCALGDFGPQTQQQLADRLDIDKSHMVGFVDDLDDRSLVVRRRDPDDRRCHRISLTPTGESVLPGLHHTAEAADAAMRTALTPAEQEQLHALLGRVLALQDADRAAESA